MGPGRPSACPGPSCSAEGEEGTSVRQWDADLQARPRSPATHMPLAGTQSHGPTCLKGGWEIRVLEETMGLARLPDLPHLGACVCPQMLRDSRFSWAPHSGLTPSSSEVGPRAPFPAGSSPAQLPTRFVAQDHGPQLCPSISVFSCLASEVSHSPLCQPIFPLQACALNIPLTFRGKLDLPNHL